MMFKFTKNISCTDATKCTDNIIEKLESKFSFKIHAAEKLNGHISIAHGKHEHSLWVFLYSKNKIHESEDSTTKKIIEQHNDRAEKLTGAFPTQKEIENAI